MKKVMALVFLLLIVSNVTANESFKSCDNCPAMILIDTGTFQLGSPNHITNRNTDEGPLVSVNIEPFAVSIYEITKVEYAKFVSEAQYESSNECHQMQPNGVWSKVKNASWKTPGFHQSSQHPVVCVSWFDVQAYIKWLNQKSSVSGESQYRYRLLSESEWEYLAKNRPSNSDQKYSEKETNFWWGDKQDDFCNYTNGADISARKVYPNWIKTGLCDDGFVYTAPVGYFKVPNRFGVYDLVGNVWEWVEDCYRDNYNNQPIDGSAFEQLDCKTRVVRGGAWGDFGSFYLRTHYRGDWNPTESFANFGFRVAAERLSN